MDWESGIYSTGTGIGVRNVGFGSRGGGGVLLEFPLWTGKVGFTALGLGLGLEMLDLDPGGGVLLEFLGGDVPLGLWNPIQS